MDTIINFPVYPDVLISLNKQEDVLNEWIKKQNIITIKDARIRNLNTIQITPYSPEQIQHNTQQKLKESFYNYIWNHC
jgi:hypothetical protein